MDTSDIITVAGPIIEAFERMNISYYIGGSVASSAYGILRGTLDVDIVADVKSHHVNLLVKMLEADYYIDAEMILEAIQRQASCNLIHLETMHKVDIFILKTSPYNQEAFQRRRKDALDEEENPDLEFYFASAEDIILSKLDWFRMGGGVSDRQWMDVMGVLKVQKDSLDLPYLQHWAEELGLTDSFAQACRDAGIYEDSSQETTDIISDLLPQEKPDENIPHA